MNNDPNRLTLEKMEIQRKLDDLVAILPGLKDTLTQINIRVKNLELMIQGDPDNSDDNKKDGINRRVKSIEKHEQQEEKIKEKLLKVALGAVTMAVGSFVLWLLRLVWANWGK